MSSSRSRRSRDLTWFPRLLGVATAGYSVAIYSMPRLLNEIRRTYDEGSDSSYIELLDRLSEVDLLHIDDVGAEKSSEWVLEQLYAIVNARYEAQRAMTITTNLDLDALV